MQKQKSAERTSKNFWKSLTEDDDLLKKTPERKQNSEKIEPKSSPAKEIKSQSNNSPAIKPQNVISRP